MIFESTRIKLTAWYVLIIMVISLSFSGFVYRNVIEEVNRGFRIRSLRTSFYTERYLVDDVAIYNEIRGRIITQLGLVNAFILLGSALAGYVLAGRTLRPIEKMVEDQKRFIGDASHELRTPLTSMKTEIEVNLRDKRFNLSDAKKLLQSNLEEVDKMQLLSNYLLSLSRYEDGVKKLPKKAIHLNKVAEKAIARFEPIAQKEHVTISPAISEVQLNGNETSLEELFSILIDNAIKYSHEHGVVRVALTQTKLNAVITVSDDGLGIKGSDIPYIFNRFYRADVSRSKEKRDGYGLGLAIAKSIVDMHNGKIKVESEPGKGATFTVILPRA